MKLLPLSGLIQTLRMVAERVNQKYIQMIKAMKIYHKYKGYMQQKNHPPMEITDTFRFGKHKGVSVENVVETNPEYITWAIGEQIIRLSNDAYNLYRDAIDE